MTHIEEEAAKYRRNLRAESMIGVPIKCLDHGFIELVDYMGDDEAIEQAARVSYTTNTNEQRTLEQRTTLIRYLMRHRHTTPFEMVELSFRVAMPIMVWRQWIRHRMASVNEFSGRYGVLPDMYYVPEEDDLCLQSKTNRQGAGEELVANADKHKILIADEQHDLRRSYEHRLTCGMANEIARINTPVSQYTVMRWKIDLHNLFHFLSLRLDSHAQKQIRVYAEAIADILHAVVPISWQAFMDYRMNACSFSAPELLALKGLVHSHDVEMDQLGMTEREQKELVAKLRKFLGLDMTLAEPK